MTSKTSLRATFVAAASACLLLAGGAQAAELVNGAYYGGGNNYAPGNWTVNTGGTIELRRRGRRWRGRLRRRRGLGRHRVGVFGNVR